MVKNIMKSLSTLLIAICCYINLSYAAEVRLKDITRVQDMRDYPLVGYGLVVGLAGTGDSEKNRITRQSLANVLKNFNINLNNDDVNSRNTAAVMITGNIHSFSESGDKLDVEVSSLGDAKSLLGGTLLVTPLFGVDQKIYALSQGPISTGSYAFQLNDNLRQKNHPTVGRIPHGAVVEKSISNNLEPIKERIYLVLTNPDITTAQRVANVVRDKMGIKEVQAINSAKIEIPVPTTYKSLNAFLAKIENLSVEPDQVARVIINERTGTVVAGGNVRISSVDIIQGDLNISIDTKYQVSQPFLVANSKSVQTAITPETKLDISEANNKPISLADGTKISDLVRALQQINLNSRSIIGILQAIQQAGALHAELIIQ